MAENDLLTVSEAANRAAVSPQTIRRWVDLPDFLVSQRTKYGRLIDRESLDRVIAERRKTWQPLPLGETNDGK